MLAYLYCAAYTRMTINGASPPCDQSCITESNVNSEFKKMCLETRFKLVVVFDILILVHVANCSTSHGRHTKKLALQSCGDGRVVRS